MGSLPTLPTLETNVVEAAINGHRFIFVNGFAHSGMHEK